ncbi:5'-3' exonuclease [Aurantivibrio infirmus]
MKTKKSSAIEKPTCLIDASIYIFQYYFSLPDHWASEDGYPTAAVYGFTTFLLRLLDEERPKKVAACFDESLGTCFRNEIYEDYKVSRPPADEDLVFQLEACREVSELLGIASFSSKRFEADDLIGTLAKKLKRSATPIAILTRDKDLGQLLSRDQDFLWDYAKNVQYYKNDIYEKFGVHSHQFIDYLALVGDSIDDIPGVPGLGPKTAQALFSNYSCLNELFENIHNVHQLPIRGAKTLGEKILLHREQILISKALATIEQNVDMNHSMSALAWRPKNVSLELLEDFCQRMGFPRLYPRIESVLV